jgi:hypothetical protein
MKDRLMRGTWFWQVAVGVLCTVTASGAEDGIPPDSAIVRTAGGCQRLLLNPMEDATSVAAGAWKMSGTYVTPAKQLSPKLGHTALTLGAADAEQAGSKGDFRVRNEVPGQVQTIGLWVHLTEDSNVARVGVQLYDAQGEALMVLVPADWTGWKWIELDSQDTESGKKNVPFLRYYTVFNLEQTEGIEIPAVERRKFQPIAEAERIIHHMPRAPVIEHKQPQAYYLPADDLVNMPNSNLFRSDEEYYSTLFHELTHSTGHASRLNRAELSKINLLKSHDYSKEELVAEMGSAFLCGRCGITPKVIENQAAYIQGWLKQLQNNKKWLIYAAAKAQKAADFILGIDHNGLEKGDPPSVNDLDANQSHLN